SRTSRPGRRPRRSGSRPAPSAAVGASARPARPPWRCPPVRRPAGAPVRPRPRAGAAPAPAPAPSWRTFPVPAVLAQRTPFAPVAVAVLEMLLFPDRAGVLHPFDQLAAGAEGLVAVRRAGRDHDRQVANGQTALRVRDVQLHLGAEARVHVLADGAETVQGQR